MTRNFYRWRCAPFMIAYAAVTSLSSQAQVSDAAFTGLLPGIIVLTPADPALPNQKTDLSVKPPQPTFQDTRQPPDKTPFVLSIRGEVNITVLQPLESAE